MPSPTLKCVSCIWFANLLHTFAAACFGAVSHECRFDTVSRTHKYACGNNGEPFSFSEILCRFEGMSTMEWCVACFPQKSIRTCANEHHGVVRRLFSCMPFATHRFDICMHKEQAESS